MALTWRYPALTFATGLLTFIFHAMAQHFPAALITVLDAAGLALFAVTGACIVVAARRAGLPPGVAALMGGAACFILRVLAVTYGWHLPTATPG
jgi:uncharacterized membrane protein YeiH